MKLRLRSLQSKETVKIEVPNSCTLQQLKETLSQSLSFSSLSSSLRFSLNKKDELQVSSPQEALQSLGITSGDLIYFSLSPNDFSPSPETLGWISSSTVQNQAQTQSGNLQEPVFDRSVNFRESENITSQQEASGPDLSVQEQAGILINFQSCRSKKSELSQESEVIDVNCQNQENSVQFLSSQETKIIGTESFNHETSPIRELSVQGQSDRNERAVSDMSDTTIIGETRELGGVADMDIDTGYVGMADKMFSEPYFLRKVLREEVGDDRTAHKLLVIAVHAVFLDSGFVLFDSESGTRIDKFRLPEGWPSMAFTMSLCYTLPELLGNGNVTESIVLKFQSLRNFVNVYGSLAKCGSQLYRLCMNECRFAPTFDLVWANCESSDNKKEYDGSEIFEFWKMVKDRLSLPLLIDICDKSGLALPPCLMLLPTELKIKIFELLPGVDIAKMACVSSEMQYLSSNNDLWKQKFTEEFGRGTGLEGMINWKARFASCWGSRRKQKGRVNERQEFRRAYRPLYFPIRRDPSPLGFPPPMIGGDFDRFPHIGIPYPFGQPGHLSLRQPGQAFPGYQVRRKFSPSCSLGGFNT